MHKKRTRTKQSLEIIGQSFFAGNTHIVQLLTFAYRGTLESPINQCFWSVGGNQERTHAVWKTGQPLLKCPKYNMQPSTENANNFPKNLSLRTVFVGYSDYQDWDSLGSLMQPHFFIFLHWNFLKTFLIQGTTSVCGWAWPKYLHLFFCYIHLSIHRLCHAFIQGRIKIVCLNGYLGSVNTSGQQELK